MMNMSTFSYDFVVFLSMFDDLLTNLLFFFEVVLNMF